VDGDHDGGFSLKRNERLNTMRKGRGDSGA
jgi:hypothetical protein